MSSGGKGGGSSSSSKTYNYYGSIAARVRFGRTDILHAIKLDGKVLWEGPVTQASSPNPYVGTIAGRGVFRYYWGLDNQFTVDPILLPGGNDQAHEHPAYTGQSYIVFEDFLFGQERNFANRISVEASAIPVQTLITGTAAQLDADGQCNPWCAWAELATSERYGQGIPASTFVASTFQSAANAALSRSDLTYVSLQLTEQQTLNQLAQDLLILMDGWLRANPQTGACEAGFFPEPQTIDPTTLPLIDSSSIAEGEDPSWDGEVWRDVKTSWVVNYTDKDKDYKSRPSQRYDDPRAVAARQLRDPETLERSFICRTNQAFEHAQRYGRRFAVPGAQGTIVVRRNVAESLRPGQHIRLDIDPEPGGFQLQQVARLLSVERPQTGSATLTVEIEPTLQPIGFTAQPPPDFPDPVAPVPDVASVRFFEAPLGLAGTNFDVGILASRPNGMVTDFAVYYDKNVGGYFPEVGSARSYALRGRFNAAYTAGATGPFSIELVESLNHEIIADDPGDAAARDDSLLMIALKIGTGGQIDADTDDKAWVEIFSCETFVAAGTNIKNVTAFRGRQGTPARAFALHDEVWFIRRSALTLVDHVDFATLGPAAGTAYFKLQPGTQLAQRPIEDCALQTFSFALERDVPDGGTTADPTFKEFRYLRSATVPSTPTGDTPSLWSLTTPLGNFAIWGSWVNRSSVTGHIVGTWSTPVRISGTIYFYETFFPSSGSYSLAVGDVLFKLDEAYTRYDWSGSAWIASTAATSITVVSVAAGSIIAGTVAVAVEFTAARITAGSFAVGAPRHNPASPLHQMPFTSYGEADLVSENGGPILPSQVATSPGTVFHSSNTTFIGWLNGSNGIDVKRFGYTDTYFHASIEGNGNVPTGRFGYDIVYRLNGGSWNIWTGHHVIGGSTFLNINQGIGRLITGLAGTDTIEWGVQIDNGSATGPGIGELLISVECKNG